MNCGSFIGELFRARDIAHIEHLQSKNMASHIVLEEFYDELVDQIDSIAEMRLARGPMQISIKNVPENVKIVKYLEMELVPLVDMAKKRMDSKGFNDISAEIDMVKTNIMKTLYKLKNLVGEHHMSGEHHEEERGEDMMEGGLLYKKGCKGGKVKCGGGKIK